MSVYVVDKAARVLRILDCFTNELKEALRSSPNDVSRLAVRRHAHNIFLRAVLDLKQTFPHCGK